MKNFVDYLTESKKTYEFKIGVAGELPESFEDRMELGLQKFGLVNLSSGKRVPISERPLDFPQLENVEVTYFDTELTYPTTQQILEDYLSDLCSVPRYHIIVRNPGDRQEEYQEKTDDTPYEALLTTEDMGGENAQQEVAGNRVMDLLKELETARKEREIDPVDSVTKGQSKDIGDAENAKSPLGS